jgi:peptide/nickel transport system permease protein
VTGGVVLLVLYTMALFAPFLAPYDYISQKGEAYQPPMRVYLTPWPTAYVSTQTFNEYRERVFTEDPNRPLPLRFFVRGEPYKLLWLIPTNVHLFGVEGEKRIHLLGTDGAGRDYLSRLLYAGRSRCRSAWSASRSRSRSACWSAARAASTAAAWTT